MHLSRQSCERRDLGQRDLHRRQQRLPRCPARRPDWSPGRRGSRENAAGAPRYPGSTRNGISSSDYASFDFSFRFEGEPVSTAPPPPPPAPPPPPVSAGPTQCPDTMRSYAGSSEVLDCICPATAPIGSVWGSETYTADSSVCTAARHAGYIGRQGGPVRLRMLPGAERYPGSTRNGISSSDFASFDFSFRFEGERIAAAVAPQTSSAPQTSTMDQCPNTMRSFAGSSETLRCVCPADAVAASVWGSDAYTADSAVCTAARHAGAIARRGGEVTIRMLAGLPRYPGTTRNGVTSSNFGPFEASYRFDIAAATGTQICPDTMSAYAGSDEQLTCLCTGEAVVRGASVWGSVTYTADSATCRAARHAGVAPMTGGTVTLRMLPGEPRYPGSTRNGVASSDFGSYTASYRFEGSQNLAASGPVQAPVAQALARTGRVSLYITFRINSADLEPAATPVLMQVRDALLADPSLRLLLVGHTDITGGPAINMPLSGRRAASVQLWLAQNGIDPRRLVAEGRGESEPIADNGSEAGRSLNRRVEAVRLD